MQGNSSAILNYCNYEYIEDFTKLLEKLAYQSRIYALRMDLYKSNSIALS